MYCVKCGVKLQECADKCPLCATPVYHPELPSAAQRQRSYPDTLPKSDRESRMPAAIAMTIVCALIVGVILAVCFRLYGSLYWGGYAALGVALFYVAAILPMWFRCPRTEIFIAADHVAAALYALYVCGKTGGNWFLPFAFPVAGIFCILNVSLICLIKYVRLGRFFVFGGFLILFGCAMMLIEFFEHLTFGTGMFTWSLYAVAGFGAAGIFLLLAALIRPLRRVLQRRFYF